MHRLTEAEVRAAGGKAARTGDYADQAGRAYATLMHFQRMLTALVRENEALRRRVEELEG